MSKKSVSATGTRNKKAFNCISCNKEDDNRMVCCDNCDSWLHYGCAGVTADVAYRDWRCSDCSQLLANDFIESQQSGSKEAQPSTSLAKSASSTNVPAGAFETPTSTYGPAGAFTTSTATNVPAGARKTSTSSNVPAGAFETSTSTYGPTGAFKTSTATNGTAGACKISTSATGGSKVAQPSMSSATGALTNTLLAASLKTTSAIGGMPAEKLPLQQYKRNKSKSSKSSKSSVASRRFSMEMQTLLEEQSILQEREALLKQKEALMDKRKSLLEAQLTLEEEDSSDSESELDAHSHVQDWLAGGQVGNANVNGLPRAASPWTEGRRAVQNETANEIRPSGITDHATQQILDKLQALELRVGTAPDNMSSSNWLPSIMPAMPSNTHCGNMLPNVNTSATHNRTVPRRLTRDQLAARKGISKEQLKFSGRPEDWPLFIATFEQTTDLCGFSEDENLMRLRDALEGPARNAVKSLPLHASCVPQIIAMLRMKFGRPELIIDVLLTQIREMPALKENQLDTLVDFAIQVQNVCATMKASGMINHLNNPELEQQLVSKLPGLLSAFWGMHKLSLPSSNLENFSQWLFQLAQGANSVLIPSTSAAKSRKRGSINIHSRTAEDSKGSCIVCSGGCSGLENCDSFVHMGRTEKWKVVRAHKLCRRCLKPHHLESCVSTTTCRVNGCEFIHHPLLHKDRPTRTTPTKAGIVEAVEVNCNAHTHNKGSILFKVLPVTLYGNGKQLDTYAFFDDGSALTLIDEELVNTLNIHGHPQPRCLRWTANTHRYEDESVTADMEISAMGSAKRFPLKDVHTVRGLELPLQTLNASELQAQYAHLQGVPLTSYADAAPRVLIGLNNSMLGISMKSKEGSEFEPVAEKTRLGWTLKGKLRHSAINSANHVFHVCDCDVAANAELMAIVKNYISLDNIDILTSTVPVLSEEDRHAIEQLERNTTRLENRYVTGLLWRSPKISFPDSFPMARRRAQCLYQKIQRNPELASTLNDKISDYLNKGYARKLQPSEISAQDGWYLPVFPVINPNKPGKVRLVWDAAAKVYGVSLNSALLKGPDKLTSMVSVIRKFRQRKIAVGGDIAEMYHQIKIREEDQKFQRFLWFETGHTEPSVFVMTVMTFGATCSPSCAQFIKNKNASEFREQFPRAVQCIVDNHYVDDMLDSVDTVEEAVQLANDVRLIHAKGGFHIRNWVSNSKAVLDALDATPTEAINLNAKSELATEKVLGLWWSMEEDCFMFRVSNKYKNNEVLNGLRPPTKREVLSLVMTIFDPLGLLGFYVMYAKIIFQETWRTGCGWDDSIQDEQYTKWQRWLKLLPAVEKMRIPRCYLKAEFSNTPRVEMHTFVDASEDGYAAVSYFRIIDEHMVNSTLLGCKTKVAPLKTMSIPRLELQAALIGARFAHNLGMSHSVNISKRFFWSDSRTVLSWLRSDHRRYRQFVAFRVSEILELTELCEWRWIPTSENVADEATKWQRTPDFTATSRWLKGPPFLALDPSKWPDEKIERTTAADDELRPQYIGCHTTGYLTPSFCVINAERFSTWKRLQRVTVAVISFAHLWKQKVRHQCVEMPLQKKLELSEALLMREAQASEFLDEITLLRQAKPVPKSSPIYCLSPYLDSSGVLRTAGRVTTEFIRDKIILPRKHRITSLVVLDVHTNYYHTNHQAVINEIVQKFYISRLRAVVRHVRQKCQVCLNECAKPKPPKMGNLHPTRIAAFCRAFSYVGVDYFGPLTVAVRRSSEKRYGVLLTCLTTRAIHLEVAYTLSADSCIIAIRNFIARRGSPVEFWSDNGTNFKGAERELREAFDQMDAHSMIQAFTTQASKWQFIPPASPHMGGAWERLVRLVKDVLYKILPSRRTTDELLRGALMEVEMIVNSRPLTFIPLEHDEAEALTPNHFLLGSSSGVKPLTEAVSEGVLLRRSWLTSQQLANAFWRRWILEYLPIITRRSKWFENVKPIEVDDIVFIVDPESPRNVWPKGRVIKVKTGADGQVRSAVVKTITGVLERPATKIAVLDVKG